MNRVQLAFLISGMVHLGIFAAGGNFLISSPTVEVTPGETRIQVVFNEPAPPVKETAPPPPAPVAEEKAVPLQPPPKELPEPVVEPKKENPTEQETNMIPSVEMQGAQYEEVDYASNPPPIYPRPAVLRNIQGKVLISVNVSERGESLEVKIEQSSGHAILDQAAVEAVQRWRFSPARLGKMAIRSQVKIPIHFKIIEKR